MIPKVKNCKGPSSLHRSKYTACVKTPLFTLIKGYTKITHMDMTNACLFLGHPKIMNYSLNSRWGKLNGSMLQAYIAQINCEMRDESGQLNHFSIS